MQNSLTQVTQCFQRSKRVLFLTSAGMSAESNIPTFRDKEGYWNNFPPFKEKGLDAVTLASPWAFRTVLPHAWAFYEWRRRNASENKPHEGYEIINKWMRLPGKEAFIHTTNTDGYHIRSGSSSAAVKEVHGSMWRLQCLNACSDDFWDNPDVPLCDLDVETMKASLFPSCRHCEGIARPHILMFNDFEYIQNTVQDRNYNEFISKKIDMVFLIGSSGTVPTNDYIAKSFKSSGAKVVNINPDPSSDKIAESDFFLQMKSLEALQEIDSQLS
ncbi:MAG: NAD-dependent deacetylase [Nitrospinota bacterium]